MKCEVCGSEEYIAGVCSSTKGAISLCYCHLCLKMGADPKWIVDFTIENCGGIENVHKDVMLTYYDKLDDVYKDVREGIIPITFNDGVSFIKKSDAIAEVKRRDNENKNNK
jgi:hypothetical protein